MTPPNSLKLSICQPNKHLHLIWFNGMIDARLLCANCTILAANTYRRLACLITEQNNKSFSLSQITSHCFATMGYRLKGNRTLEYHLFMFYLFVLFHGVQRRKMFIACNIYRSLLPWLFCKRLLNYIFWGQTWRISKAWLISWFYRWQILTTECRCNTSDGFLMES